MNHVFTRTFSRGGGGGSVDFSRSIEVEAEQNLDVVIPDGSTNLEILFSLEADNCSSLLMISDQDITIYTNDAGSGTPSQTIALKANKPLAWDDAYASLIPCPLQDVTANIFVTNASGEDARLRIFSGGDANAPGA